MAIMVALSACSTAPSLARGNLCRSAAAEIDAAAAETLRRGSPGMVVRAGRAGELVLARAYGLSNLEHRTPMTEDAVFRVASVTKQFTAAAILLLVEEGRLNLHDRLAQYVPELPQARDITIYQLLVQTSGLADYANDEAAVALQSIPRTSQQMISWIATLEPESDFSPGDGWQYSNSNYALLGAVIERITGQSLQVFYAERLFAPAGLEHTGFDEPGDIVSRRASGYRRASDENAAFENAAVIHWTIPGAAGGLRSTAGDLVRWSEALFSGAVVSPESLSIMSAPGLLSDGRTTKWGMPEAWREGLDADYGMGLFINASVEGYRLWHSGDIAGFAAWLGHYPEHELTIAVLQNSESAPVNHSAIERALIRAVANGCEFPL